MTVVCNGLVRLVNICGEIGRLAGSENQRGQKPDGRSEAGRARIVCSSALVPFHTICTPIQARALPRQKKLPS